MAARQPVDVAEFIDDSAVSGFQVTLMVICGLVAMLDGFDAQLIGYVVPAIAHGWGIAGSAIGASFKWVFAAGLFGLTLGALLGGPLADRVGRKTVMLASVAGFGLFTLLSALAATVPQLILLRFLTGLGLGGAMPNTIALTAEYAPHRLRSTLITAMFVGFPVGNVIAGLVSVPLMRGFGWPGVFYFGGLLPLILLPVAATLLPESVRFLVARDRSTARVANILERIRPDPRLDDDPRFLVREKALDGVPVKHLFREGRAAGTLLLWTAFFMNLLIIYFFVSWLPLILGQVGLSAEHSIWTAALFNTGGALGGVGIGWLTDRGEPYRLIIGSFAAGALAIAAISLAGASLPLLVATIFLAGLTVVGAQFGINALAAHLYPTPMRSTGVSWGLGIGRLGSIVGPYIGGVLLQQRWDPHQLFLAAAVPAVVATIAMVFMSRTTLARHI